MEKSLCFVEEGMVRKGKGHGDYVKLAGGVLELLCLCGDVSLYLFLAQRDMFKTTSKYVWTE